jgi:nucleoside-diphosphate-sugar epimerase
MKIAVTGANGFIGAALVRHFVLVGFEVVAVVRDQFSEDLIHPSVTLVSVESLENCKDWSFLRDVDVVVHSAGKSSNSRFLGKSVCVVSNVTATEMLVKNVLNYEVKKFIFLSSAKIYGESSAHGEKYSEIATPAPRTVYAETKLQAESVVKSLRGESTDFIILRLPAVYGMGEKGAIGKLRRAIELGIPLPLGLALAQRSFINVINLVDLVTLCFQSERASNKIFNVSDLTDISVREFAIFLAKLINKNLTLLDISPEFLKLVGRMLLSEHMAISLTEPFCLDCSYLSEELNWRPVFKFDGELSGYCRK